MEDALQDSAHRALDHKSRPISFVWLALFALAFTAFQINWSFREYRLRAEPVYDDANYLLDGIFHINQLDSHSVSGWIGYLLANPPRSSYCSAVACLAFKLFGSQEWAPYALNGVLIFIMLWEIKRMSRGLGWYLQALLLLATLCLPLSQTAIVDFRPDFAEALFVAVVVWRSMQLKFLTTSPQPASAYLALTIYSWLAWLAKPTFFLHTALLMLIIVILCLGVGNDRKNSAHALRIVGAILLGSVLAMPFYLRFGRGVWEYFSTHTGSGSLAAVWRIPGGYLGSLHYYLIGDAGSKLAAFLTPIVIIVGVGLLWVVRRDRQKLTFFCSVGAR